MDATGVRQITADEFERSPDWKHFELIGGVPVEKASGARAGAVGAALAMVFGEYLRANRIGRVYGPAVGYRLRPGDPWTVRKPDFSMVRVDRLPGGRSPPGDFHLAPDFAVEVIAPAELYEDAEAKVNEYLSAGVRLVWVVSPESRTVLVRRPDGTAAVIAEGGRLSGEDVIPGFDCPAAELFS